MTLPKTTNKSRKSVGIESMNTSCTTTNFPMNPYFSTLFSNLTSQQQQQQQLFTQLLLSGRSISLLLLFNLVLFYIYY